MRVIRHRQYDKAWRKLSHSEQKRAIKALQLFLEDPQNKKLRVHQLKGSYYPQFSISVGGDLRIHYDQLDTETIILMVVGTHARLYG